MDEWLLLGFQPRIKHKKTTKKNQKKRKKSDKGKVISPRLLRLLVGPPVPLSTISEKKKRQVIKLGVQ